jgi:hypothetical protein
MIVVLEKEALLVLLGDSQQIGIIVLLQKVMKFFRN